MKAGHNGRRCGGKGVEFKDAYQIASFRKGRLALQAGERETSLRTSAPVGGTNLVLQS